MHYPLRHAYNGKGKWSMIGNLWQTEDCILLREQTELNGFLHTLHIYNVPSYLDTLYVSRKEVIHVYWQSIRKDTKTLH